MAKKKTDGPESAARPAATRRRASASTATSKTADARPDPGVAEPGVTPAVEPLDLAADMSVGASSSDSAAAREPSHEEIAEAAYQRFLERGANHGRDWDDWLEAERALKTR